MPSSNSSTFIDDDEPFSLTGTGTDADWLLAIPPRRDLLTYAQARSDWKCSDADLAGLVNANRVDAYELKSGQLSPFQWTGMLPTGNWRTMLPTLLFNPVPDFDPESETRYLDYPAAIALLKKRNPKLDAVAMLEQETGAATGELNWSLLAISLNSEPLTVEPLTRSIYRVEQVQSLIDRIKVKKKPTRKNLAWMEPFGGDKKKIRRAIVEAYITMTQGQVSRALKIPIDYIQEELKNVPHHPRGTKRKQ